MKAQVLTGIGQMEMREAAKPAVVNDDDVLLKIEVVGVCGSDVHYYETGRIGSQIIEYPYMVGDEVVVDPAVSCMECSQCKAGRENTCEKLLFLGTPGQGNGCLCEYIVMPERSCYPTGGKITLGQGVLMLIGIPRVDRVSFVIDKIRRKEITIINVRRQNGCTREAIDLIAQKKVELDFMITHNFNFADSKEAFDMVAEYRDGVVKAMIQM